MILDMIFKKQMIMDLLLPEEHGALEQVWKTCGWLKPIQLET